MKRIVEVWVFAVWVLGVGVGVVGGWKLHCKKWMSAPTPPSEVPSSLLLLSAAAVSVCACLGSGRINCGFDRAASAIRWYVSSGMVAQIDSGLFACLSRHSASISLGGRVRIFSMSRKELSGLMPGAPDTVFAAVATGDDDDGGGGGEKGVFASALLPEEEEEEGFCISSGATADAFRRYSSILSLYASFNDSIESWPSLDTNKTVSQSLSP